MAERKKSFQEEVAATVKKINNFWPDYSITKENILNPTPDHVIDFYKRCLIEMKSQMQSVQADVDSRDEPDEVDMENVAGIGGEFPLYLELVIFFKRFSTTFLLTDLYDPQPKRTHYYFKLANHFLSFINNKMDDLSSVAEASLQKIDEMRHLRNLEQQALQGSAENAENISRMLDTNQKLKIKSEKIDLEYKKMMEVKSEEDKRYNDKLALKKNQQTELDTLEFEFQYAENKEKELEECAVSEEDFENLKKSEQFLTNGLEQMNDEYNKIDAELQTDTTYKAYKQMEENQATLEHLNYDNFHILSTLHDDVEKIKMLKNEKNELFTNQEAIHKKLEQKRDRVNIEKQNLKEINTMYSEFMTATAIEVEKINKCHKEQEQLFQDKYVKRQELLSEIAQNERDIQTLAEQEKFVKEHSEIQIQNILNNNHTLTSKFKTVLEAIKNTQI